MRGMARSSVASTTQILNLQGTARANLLPVRTSASNSIQKELKMRNAAQNSTLDPRRAYHGRQISGTTA
jgi:hypothetical protein